MNTPSGTVHRTFPVTGPLHLDVKVGIGSVTVRARDDLTEAVVTVTPAAPVRVQPGRTDPDRHARIDLVVHAAKLGGVLDLIRRRDEPGSRGCRPARAFRDGNQDRQLRRRHRGRGVGTGKTDIAAGSSRTELISSMATSGCDTAAVRPEWLG